VSTLDELRKRNIAEQKEDTAPVDTGTRKPVSTDGREDGHTAVRTGGSADGSTDGRQDVRADLRTRIRERLSAKAAMTTGVKATIDMTPELSKRVKRYGLDHPGGTLRQMCIVFLEEFLNEEGY
jgi:hypothetical protein